VLGFGVVMDYFFIVWGTGRFVNNN